MNSNNLKKEISCELTIVVPCFNEEKFITQTLKCIKEALDPLQIEYEVIVIDDCSLDKTFETASKFKSDNPNFRVHVIQNKRNRGLSRSYCDAAFLGIGKYFRLVCGDNSETAESIQKIVEARHTADMILPYHPEVPGKSLLRRFISKTYTKIINKISGNNIQYYNGCALTTRYDVMRWGSYSFGFGFQADLITRLLAEGRSYAEVPVEVYHHENDAAASAFRVKNILSVIHTLIEIGFRSVRSMGDKRL